MSPLWKATSLISIVSSKKRKPRPILLPERWTEKVFTAFTDEVRAAEKKRSSAKLTATQNIGAGLYVGGTKVASGTLFSIAGFNHHYNVKTVRAGHVTNDLLFTASVIAIPAGAFSMLDTLRIQIMGEIRSHRSRVNGTLPQQLIAVRLKQLDEQESRIKGLKP
jgi:hypothetical protein